MEQSIPQIDLKFVGNKSVRPSTLQTVSSLCLLMSVAGTGEVIHLNCVCVCGGGGGGGWKGDWEGDSLISNCIEKSSQ